MGLVSEARWFEGEEWLAAGSAAIASPKLAPQERQNLAPGQTSEPQVGHAG